MAYYHPDITHGNPVQTSAPDVVAGDMVVLQTHNEGLDNAINARVMRAYSGGFADLAYFPQGLDAKQADGSELTEPRAGVAYSSDGNPVGTWHMAEVQA